MLVRMCRGLSDPWMHYWPVSARPASTARELLFTLVPPLLLLLAKTPALDPLSILPPRLSHGLVPLEKFELSPPHERFQRTTRGRRVKPN